MEPTGDLCGIERGLKEESHFAATACSTLPFTHTHTLSLSLTHSHAFTVSSDHHIQRAPCVPTFGAPRAHRTEQPCRSRTLWLVHTISLAHPCTPAPGATPAHTPEQRFGAADAPAGAGRSTAGPCRTVHGSGCCGECTYEPRASSSTLGNRHWLHGGPAIGTVVICVGTVVI